MGKKDKKKKGMGAEKTISKTEKKLLAKQKKLLEQAGEEDIEKLVSQFDKKNEEKIVTELVQTTSPSARVNFSICQNPEKEEIFIFGGEFFNGKKTDVYGEFYNYNIAKNEWKLVKSSVAPAPRSGKINSQSPFIVA